ncbi:hypothetical protein A4A49_60035, partial [Nicotiana attenuata]
PTKGWLKANIDGAFNNINMEGGISGVVRDSKERWNTAFSMKVHAISPMQTELQALMHALQIIIREHMFPIEVETDATEIISIINKDYSTNNELCHICRLLVEEASRKGRILFKHSFREGNMVAHILAKEALRRTSFNRLCTFCKPPDFVMDVYDKYREGYVYARSCSSKHCETLITLGNNSAL